ncbi:MAG: hypothetical protein ACRDSG_05840 [Pseudonocardiaceae bacterium]
MSLPPVVEGLLVDVVADGFVVYCCGPKTAPNALVACYEWERYVDLVTIRDFDRITTARVPARDKLDIFAPETVVWIYEGPPQQALRTLLCLVPPCASRRAFHSLPGASEPARSPRRATPDDDPAPVPGPGRGPGCPARHRDDDPRPRGIMP